MLREGWDVQFRPGLLDQVLPKTHQSIFATPFESLHFSLPNHEESFCGDIVGHMRFLQGRFSSNGEGPRRNNLKIMGPK